MSQKDDDKKSSRIFYFDYLRLFIIGLVVFLHALLPHVKDYDWYINSSQLGDLHTLLALHIDVFIMPIMFFVAGYFSYPSLVKRGIKSFLYSKVKRILLPFIAGLTLFSPIMSYLGLLANTEMSPSYAKFWTTIYFSEFLKPAHYWFLSSLFFFYLTFSLIYYFYQDQIKDFYDQKLEMIKERKDLLLLSFFVIGILLFFIVGLFSPDGSWISLFNIFSFQPTRWTIYLLYFYLGIFAYLTKLKLTVGILARLKQFIALSIILSVAYLAFKITFISSLSNSLLLQLINAGLHFGLCFSIFITLLLFFKKYFNQPSSLLNRLASQSYRIYFFHMVIVVLIQYLLRGVGFSIYLKTIITFISSSILTYLLSEIYTAGYQKLIDLSSSVALNKQKSSEY